jgi:hypothetical protein
MSEWILAQGEIDGKPLTVRVRESIEGIDRAAYPTRIVLAWPLTAPQPNGLPSPHDHEVLAGFEALLRRTLEADALAVHAFAITHAGSIEWHFHTRDDVELRARVARLDDERVRRVKVSLHEDPGWTEWETLVKNASD